MMWISSAIIGLIITLFVHKLHHNTRGTILTIISIALTLLSIMVAIADDYFSQYDYNFTKIWKYQRIKKRGIYFDDLFGDLQKNCSPEYVVVLDISGSTKTRKEDFSETTKFLLEYINDKMRIQYQNSPISLKPDKENKIPFNELMRVRLIKALIRIDSLEREKNTVISLFRFEGRDSTKCDTEILKENCTAEMNNSDAIKKLINIAKTETFEGKNSNFVNLFKDIKRYILAHINKQESIPSNYNPKDYVFIFLTDYLHDPEPDEKKKYSKREMHKQLASLIREIDNYNVHISLFVIEDDICVPKPTQISVDDLFEENLLFANYRKTDLRDNGNELNYQLVLHNPIPFYYTNSLFEKDTKTTITFNSLKTIVNLSFGINEVSKSGRQEYLISFNDDTTKVRLSKNLVKKDIQNKGRASFYYTGYIPSPDNAPEVIIEDSSKGVQYVIPVVFFKNFPQSGLWLFYIVVGLGTGILWLFIKNNHHKPPKTQKQEKKNKGGIGFEFSVN